MIVKRHVLANALRVAAEQYEKASNGQPERLAVQFQQQADHASRLADHIENGEPIRLED